MRVTSLHLHPIKGCHRVEVHRAVAGPYGLVGDREWQVVDAAGDFVTQREHPQLTGIHPALTDDGIVLRAAGMADLEVARPAIADTTAKHYTGEAKVGDGGDAAAAWLSDVLGEPVRLVGIAPGYERDVFGAFRTQAAFGDAAPIVVANDASHAFLAERAIEPFGPDRWRANIWVDGDRPWDEDTWRTLRVGEATITLVLPWPRCAVPQVDQDVGTRHREPALVLRAHRWCEAVPEGAPPIAAALPGNALFGVGGAVEPAGAVIRVGDEVSVVESGEPLI